jgi:hypothetical protein
MVHPPSVQRGVREPRRKHDLAASPPAAIGARRLVWVLVHSVALEEPSMPVQLHGKARSGHATADLYVLFEFPLSELAIGYWRCRTVAARAGPLVDIAGEKSGDGRGALCSASYLEDCEKITEVCFCRAVMWGRGSTADNQLALHCAAHSQLLEYQHFVTISATCGQHREWWRPRLLARARKRQHWSLSHVARLDMLGPNRKETGIHFALLERTQQSCKPR